MRSGLITTSEVVNKSGIDGDFPVCDLRTALNIEINEFNGCLGKKFYKDLKACLAVYECETWCPNDDDGNEILYAKDKAVKYKGIYYISLKDDNNAIPSDRSCWGFAPKFDQSKPCGLAYEELWCEYLCEYLALSVIKIRLPFIRTKISKDGIITIFGNGFQAADNKAYDSICNAIDNMIAIVFANMDDWMKENNQTDEENLNCVGCFDSYKGIAESCCGDCGCDLQKCTCEGNCLTGKQSAGRINVG